MQHLIAKINYYNYFITYANWFHCFIEITAPWGREVSFSMNLCSRLVYPPITIKNNTKWALLIVFIVSEFQHLKENTWKYLETSRKRRNPGSHIKFIIRPLAHPHICICTIFQLYSIKIFSGLTPAYYSFLQLSSWEYSVSRRSESMCLNS